MLSHLHVTQAWLRPMTAPCGVLLAEFRTLGRAEWLAPPRDDHPLSGVGEAFGVLATPEQRENVMPSLAQVGRVAVDVEEDLPAVLHTLLVLAECDATEVAVHHRALFLQLDHLRPP